VQVLERSLLALVPQALLLQKHDHVFALALQMHFDCGPRGGTGFLERVGVYFVDRQKHFHVRDHEVAFEDVVGCKFV